MIFSKRLRSHDHTRTFVVGESHGGSWEVREEEDNQVVKRTWLHDWHGVEKAMMKFAIQAISLENAGWTEVQTAEPSIV